MKKVRNLISQKWLFLVILSCALMILMFSAGTSSAAPENACGGYHYVQKGETLFLISKQYGVPIPALMQANPGIPNPNLIYAGTYIFIPCGPGGPGTGGPCQSVHVIAWGESLSEIAWNYGVSQNAIARANGIANPNLIFAGQSLCIP